MNIVSPFEENLIKDTFIEINPTKYQVIRFKNILSIDIPKDAFVDKNGNIVKDKVLLSIKTYDNPAAIIASGIPMQYGEEAYPVLSVLATIDWKLALPYFNPTDIANHWIVNGAME